MPTTDDTGDLLTGTLIKTDPATRNQGAQPTPIVILLHGLGGSAESVYVNRTASYLLSRRIDVLTFNFRGAGSSSDSCSKHNNPGRTEDLDALIQFLVGDSHILSSERRCVMASFSLGGTIMLKFLTSEIASKHLSASVSISAPLDLAATSERLGDWRNLPYRTYLLKKLRDRLLRDESLTPNEEQAIRSARSIRQLDSDFVAPREGFESVDDYYAAYSTVDSLDGIQVPSLLLYALDDPFIPRDTYQRIDWSDLPSLSALIVENGGHTGFRSQHGAAAWHDQCIARLSLAN